MRTLKVALRVVPVLWILLGMGREVCLGQSTTWNRGIEGSTGIWRWDDAGNWTAGVPVDAGRAEFVRINWNKPIGIDTVDANLNLPSMDMGYGQGNGGSNLVFFDSTFLTPDGDGDGLLASTSDLAPVNPAQTLVEAANTSPTLTVRDMIWNKQHWSTFYMPVVINGRLRAPENTTLEFYGDVTAGSVIDTNNRGWQTKLIFHGGVTAGTFDIPFRSTSETDGQRTWFHGAFDVTTFNHKGGYLYIEPTASGTIGTLNLSGGTIRAKSGAMTIGALNWTGGTMRLEADGLLSGFAAVPAGGVLSLVSQQTAWPGLLTVRAGGALAGDLTGAWYNSETQPRNVVFEEDAILAPAAGPVPTRADLGGAILWQGAQFVSDATEFNVGDDGTGIYKGLVFAGAFGSSGNIRGRFRANSGSGDLNIQVREPVTCAYNQYGSFIGDGSSTTANLTFDPGASVTFQKGFNTNWQSWPSADDQARRIRTFNLTRPPGNEAAPILVSPFNGQKPKVMADQTLNVSGGRVSLEGFHSGGAYPDDQVGKFQGRVVISRAILDVVNRPTFVPDEGILELGEGAVVKLLRNFNENMLGYFEGLTTQPVGGAERFVLSGDTIVYFRNDRNQDKVIELDFGAMPNFQRLLLNSDIIFEPDNAGDNRIIEIDGDNDGDGTVDQDLAVSDGKYVLSVSHGAVRPVHDEKIVLAGGAGPEPSVGMAAIRSGRIFYQEMDVDLGAGTLLLGSDTPLTGPDRENGENFLTQIPAGTVALQPAAPGDTLTVTAGKIDLRSGGLTLGGGPGGDVVLNTGLLVFDSSTGGGLRIQTDTIDNAGPLTIRMLAGNELRFSGLTKDSDPATTQYFDLGDTSFEIGADVTGAGVNFGGGGNWAALKVRDLQTDAAIEIDDGCHILVTGRLSGTGKFTYRNYVHVGAGGTLAPGNGVGQINIDENGPGVGIRLEDTAAYEWEIADPDGEPGAGWDLAWGNPIDFDTDDDDVGSLTFRIVDAGLTRDLAAEDEFIVAAGGNFDIPADWTVTFEAPTGWDVSGAQLALGAMEDVNGDGKADRTLRLTGVVSVRTMGTLAWSADANGTWGPDAPGRWTLVGDWHGPGGEPNYPNDPFVAAVVDTPWTVTVQDANQQAYSLEVRGGGGAAVAAGRTLALTDTASVEADGALEVAGALTARALHSAGATRIPGGTVTAEETSLTGGEFSVEAGGSLQAGSLSVNGGSLGVASGGSLDAAATALAGGEIAVGAGAAVDLGELEMTGGSLDLSADASAANATVTGGVLRTGERAVVVSGVLTVPAGTVASDAPSFRLAGAGQAGELTVGITAENSTTTVTPAGGAGDPLEMPTTGFHVSTPLAELNLNASSATLGDLSFSPDSGVQLSGAMDVSVRDLAGVGLLVGDVTVRRTLRPGPVAGWMEVLGRVTLQAAAAFQPEVQGPNSLGVLYVDDVLDLTAADDRLAVWWTPGAEPNSAFGGTYRVAEAGSIDGEFDDLGAGNIGEAYIAAVDYVSLPEGAEGIDVTLHALLRGDADLDGDVDGADFDSIVANFGADGTSRSEGDLSYDGQTDAADYLAWKFDVGSSVPGPVPEPCSLLLVASGFGAVLLVGRRSAGTARRRG